MKYLDKHGVETFWSKLKGYAADICVTKEYVDEQIDKYHGTKYPKIRGVYVYDMDGNYTKPAEWDTTNNDNVVGIAVVDIRGHNEISYTPTTYFAFIVALTDCTKRAWGSRKLLIDGCTTIYDDSTATGSVTVARRSYDVAGEANTDAIIAAQGTSADGYAAYECKNYVFPNGKNGYLPTITELYSMDCFSTDLNSALTLVGGTEIASNEAYWSSTQFDTAYAWRLEPNGSTGQYAGNKDWVKYVRAVCTAT